MATIFLLYCLKLIQNLYVYLKAFIDLTDLRSGSGSSYFSLESESGLILVFKKFQDSVGF